MTEVTKQPSRPLVTFALFAYNQEKYIREAVESAFAQTYEPMEIILSDDCSTDNTFEIMQKLVSGYRGQHSVQLNRNEPNLGLVAHVNHVMGMVTGEIIVIAAGDDISLHTRVRDSVEGFSCYPEVSMVSFVDGMIDSEGDSLFEAVKSKDVAVIDLSDFLRNGPKAQGRLQISGASRTIRRKSFLVFGNLLPDCPGEDTPILLRGLYTGKALVCHWPSIKYRRHKHQLSTENSISKMDSSLFKEQYLQDLAIANSMKLVDSEIADKVRCWINERDLYLRLRQMKYSGEIPGLRIVVSVILSRDMSVREKLGMLKRYVMRRRID